jgi:UDP:flavonoid glycosyltransferase YjiC (YdhE family)
MKLGLICPNLPGHLNPVTALARQLQERGHEVVFLYSKRAAGLRSIPEDRTDHFNENRSNLSKRQGEDALEYTGRLVMAQTEVMLKSLPE